MFSNRPHGRFISSSSSGWCFVPWMLQAPTPAPSYLSFVFVLFFFAQNPGQKFNRSASLSGGSGFAACNQGLR